MSTIRSSRASMWRGRRRGTGAEDTERSEGTEEFTTEATEITE
jgi:hypothetical protein